MTGESRRGVAEIVLGLIGLAMVIGTILLQDRVDRQMDAVLTMTQSPF